VSFDFATNTPTLGKAEFDRTDLLLFRAQLAFVQGPG